MPILVCRRDNVKDLWHRHLGVYGVCVHDGKILLIHKSRGPYTDRYDLPGGTVEPNESLVDALRRECKEETGVHIDVIRNLGVQDYVIPFKLEKRGTTHIHHIAIYYEIEYVSGELAPSTEMDQNDAVRAEWVDIHKVSLENSSPLAMQAVAWLKGEGLKTVEAARVDGWVVKD